MFLYEALRARARVTGKSEFASPCVTRWHGAEGATRERSHSAYQRKISARQVVGRFSDGRLDLPSNRNGLTGRFFWAVCIESQIKRSGSPKIKRRREI
jgi:hypothetical protein